MKHVQRIIDRMVSMLVALSLIMSSVVPAVASAQSFNDILGRSQTSGETKARRMNAAQIRDARAAKALYESATMPRQAFSGLPPSRTTEVYDPRNAKRAVVLKAQLAKAVADYEAAKTASSQTGTPIDAAVMVRLRDATEPFVRFLDRMRQASGRAPPLTVAPGQVRTFDLPAYCMDSNLAAPKRGEAFRIVPMTDLMPPELLPVIKGMMSRPAGFSYDTQSLVWALRNAYRNGSPIEMSPDRMAALEATAPGATQAIAAYNQKASRTKMARGLMDGLLPGMRQNVSSLMDTAKSLSPQQIASDVRDRMAALESMPVAGDINPDAAYTTLAPGVAAQASSPNGGAHNAVISIANTTDDPFTFEQTAYVAQSERPVQHLALQLPKGYGSDDGTSGFSLAELISFGLDISTVGNIKAAMQALLGFDIITGEPVNRWMEVLGMLPAIGQELRLARGALKAGSTEARLIARSERSGGLVVHGEKPNGLVARPATKAQDLTVPTSNANPIREVKVQSGGKGAWNKELHKPAPNTTYRVDGTHVYRTDAQGKVTEVETTLSGPQPVGPRNGYQQIKAGKSGQPGDQGGHMIASVLGGPGEGINLEAMAGVLNNGPWKSMEKQWKDTLNAGGNVDFKIQITRDPTGRPTSFFVTDRINGGPTRSRTFPNR